MSAPYLSFLPNLSRATPFAQTAAGSSFRRVARRRSEFCKSRQRVMAMDSNSDGFFSQRTNEKRDTELERQRTVHVLTKMSARELAAKRVLFATMLLASTSLGAAPSPPAESFSCPKSTGVERKISVGAIAGLYRRRAQIGKPEPQAEISESRRYDYLAITPSAGDVVRVRLSTVERNGHDCHLDSYAAICGSQIFLRPGKEDLETLARRGMAVPRLAISPRSIYFVDDESAGFTSGPPYCGTMGYLRHSFPRSDRKTSFDASIFQ